MSAIVTWALASGGILAYVGPGSGLSALGALLAVVAAVFLTIVGFVWYPLKRFLRARAAKRSAKSG